MIYLSHFVSDYYYFQTSTNYRFYCIYVSLCNANITNYSDTATYNVYSSIVTCNRIIL